MLAGLAEQRSSVEGSGTQPVLVHMMPDADAAKLFGQYGLEDVPRISDPDRHVYRGFGLTRGSVRQVMGPGVLWRGLKATLLSGHRPGKPAGDVFQLPGVFLIADGAIVRAFQPETSAARADFEELAACPSGSCDVKPGSSDAETGTGSA